MTSKVLHALFVFALTFAVYLPSIHYNLVRIDDPEYILENRHIEQGLTYEVIKWAFTDVGYASNWHPLTWISHALDVSIAHSLDMIGSPPKDNPNAWIGYNSKAAHIMHAHNVLLHALNATFLFILIGMLMYPVKQNNATDIVSDLPKSNCNCHWLLSKPALATFASLIWAVHPLRCEVVCWVSERKEVLSVFWMLLTLIVWLKSKRSNSHPLYYALSLVFFALALMSKPVAVTLPVVIMACEWILFQHPFRKAFLHAIPFVALSAGVCIVTLFAQTEALEFGRQISWPLRIECALEAPIVYLRQTIFPSNLSPVYLRSIETDWPLAIAGIALIGVMLWICLRWIFRKEKTVGVLVFIIAWSYIGLIPMIGLVKVGGQAHSDRYTYWVGCGIAAGTVIIFNMFLKPAILRNKQIFAVLCGLVTVLCLLTLERSSYWRSTVILYRDTVSKSHDAEIAFQLADELVRMQKGVALKEAEIMLRDTVSSNPDPKAYAALAYFLAFHSTGQAMITDPEAGSFLEARNLANKALLLDSECWIAHAALAACNARDRRWDAAVKHGEKAISMGAKDVGFIDLISECRLNAAKNDKSKGGQ